MTFTGIVLDLKPDNPCRHEDWTPVYETADGQPYIDQCACGARRAWAKETPVGLRLPTGA